MNRIPKLIGFIVKQLFDGKEKKYFVFDDSMGLHYFNDNGERIACLQSEIIV